MPRLLCFGIISCCLLPGVSLGQGLGVDDYVTGMTVIGKPGAGPDCPRLEVGADAVPSDTQKAD